VPGFANRATGAVSIDVAAFPTMRRPSVADALRDAQRAQVAALPPGERVLLALELGSRSLDLYCARSGLSRQEALRAREVRKQARRRRSRCIEALRA
jgi:hypothetical protein